MEEKEPHTNQYKEPHFTCEIHYGPDSIRTSENISR